MALFDPRKTYCSVRCSNTSCPSHITKDTITAAINSGYNVRITVLKRDTIIEGDRVIMESCGYRKPSIMNKLEYLRDFRPSFRAV